MYLCVYLKKLSIIYFIKTEITKTLDKNLQAETNLSDKKLKQICFQRDVVNNNFSIKHGFIYFNKFGGVCHIFIQWNLSLVWFAYLRFIKCVNLQMYVFMTQRKTGAKKGKN